MDSMDLSNDRSYDYWDYKMKKKHFPEQFNEERNIERDEHGRLNKGAKLAQMYNRDKIWELYCSGMTPKQIIGHTGYKKSTVYAVIKEYKDRTE